MHLTGIHIHRWLMSAHDHLIHYHICFQISQNPFYNWPYCLWKFLISWYKFSIWKSSRNKEYSLLCQEKSSKKYSLLRQGKIRFLDQKTRNISSYVKGKAERTKKIGKAERKKNPSYVKGKVDFLLEFQFKGKVFKTINIPLLYYRESRFPHRTLVQGKYLRTINIPSYVKEEQLVYFHKKISV